MSEEDLSQPSHLKHVDSYTSDTTSGFSKHMAINGVCEHGGMRRKCEICERKEELVSLRSQLALSEAREVEMREALLQYQSRSNWGLKDEDGGICYVGRQVAVKALSSSGSYTMERMRLMQDIVEYARCCWIPSDREREPLKKAIESLDALEKMEKKK